MGATGVTGLGLRGFGAGFAGNSGAAGSLSGAGGAEARLFPTVQLSLLDGFLTLQGVRGLF